MRHLKGTFGPTERLQKSYEQAIRKISGKVLAPQMPEETLEQWLARLQARSQEQDIQEASESLATKMVHWVNVGNRQTWRQAAALSQRSRMLHRLLAKEMEGQTGLRVQQLIAENAKYISSVSTEAAEHLVHEVRAAQQNGARAGTVAKMMRARFPALIRSRVHLIARTESAKASAALTQARSEALNIEFYKWVTSEDGRVRGSHAHMNDVIVPWNDVPNPDHLAGVKSTLGAGHAGEFPNCRCTSMPVLDFDDLTFPCRVYHQGAIHQMNKQQFIKQFAAHQAA